MELLYSLKFLKSTNAIIVYKVIIKNEIEKEGLTVVSKC